MADGSTSVSVTPPRSPAQPASNNEGSLLCALVGLPLSDTDVALREMAWLTLFIAMILIVGAGLAGSWLISRSESVRGAYLKRLERQRRGLAVLARRFSWTYSMHRTDRSPEGALLQLYQLIAELRGVGGRR